MFGQKKVRRSNNHDNQIMSFHTFLRNTVFPPGHQSLHSKYTMDPTENILKTSHF